MKVSNNSKIESKASQDIATKHNHGRKQHLLAALPGCQPVFSLEEPSQLGIFCFFYNALYV